MTVRTTNRFKKDLKRAESSGKDLDKLWVVLETLLAGCGLQSRHRQHRLSGEWSDFWECHIEPDWLLIRESSEHALVPVRTGTHSDLFG